jgi:alpha-mannosidase
MYPHVISVDLPKTMKDNFALFEKYPHYTFNFTGSNRYRLMKEYYPEDYAKLKKYVAAGRWFPGGSSVEEGDVNSPSLESLVRQVMYGNRYFEKDFGKSSSEYMLPDCFGFPAALPSILAHCGLKGFSTQKLTWGSAVGIPFNVGVWKGPDGRSIVAALNPESYGSEVKDDLSHDDGWIKRVQEDGKKDGIYADYHYFGTGDEGGAPSEDSVKWVEKSITGDGPLKVVGGRSDQMFNDLTQEDIAKLPVYQGDLELTQHSAGSLTSQAEMKRWNHQNEKLAEAAEKADVAAMLLGAADYPTDRLGDAWNHFLTCQFHDMMAGTARPLAYTYAWNDECIAMNEFASAITAGVGGIARGMDLSGPGTAIIVYNPLAIERTDVVEATVPSNAKSFAVIAPDGTKTAAQYLYTDGGKAHVAFNATAPSVGLAVYHVVEEDNVEAAPMATDNTLENSFVKVTIDSDGNVSSIIDKQTGKETLSAPIKLAFEAEAPSQYPAWNMDWKDQQKPPYAFVDGPAKISIVENGPVRAAIQVDRTAQGSHFVQQVRLMAGSKQVDFLDKIDWKSTGCALKATFPLVAANPMATYNWQVGTVQRDNNNEKKYEVASHRWFDLTDKSGDFGCSVLTGSKNASDKPDDSTVRLTLIYTPTPTGGFYEQGFQDWGHHEIEYALYPHSGDWKSAETPLQALRLDQPMMTFAPEGAGNSHGSKAFSLLTVSDPHISVVAVKKAEDSDEVIVRVREDNGVAATGVHLAFLDGISGAREVDGQEHPLGAATVSNGELVFNIDPYNVRAFALKVRHPKGALPKTNSRPVQIPYNLDAISDRTNPGDGNFDGAGRSMAGDQLPENLEVDTVKFKMGPKEGGQLNAVACQGQTIDLPKGNWNRVYILAASAKGDREVTFKTGDTNHMVKVQDWGGYVGEWDTRVWQKPQEDPIYGWDNNAYEGLTPGYMKMASVAWDCDHRHDAKGDEIYQYSYLFKYGMDLNGADTLTLPDDPNVIVLAVSVADNSDDQLKPADPLYDTLPRTQSAPVIAGAGKHSDSVQVTIAPGLYGVPSEIMYSTDGTEPTKYYTGPFWVSSNTVVKARFGSGPVADADIDVEDNTAPKVVRAQYWSGLDTLELKFSEPIDKDKAQDLGSYSFGSGKAATATVSPDGETVTLTTDGVSQKDLGTIKVAATDVSPNRNSGTSEVPVDVAHPVFSLAKYVCDGKEFTQPDKEIPTKGSAPWTMNFFIKCSKLPDDHTEIAGFGDVQDRRDGAARYFCQFDEGGLRFWGRNIDLPTNTQLDLNQWQMLTATYDGTNVTVYKDGHQIANGSAELRRAPGVIHIAPLDGWVHQHQFTTGEVANFTIWDSCLGQSAVTALAKQKPQ